MNWQKPLELGYPRPDPELMELAWEARDLAEAGRYGAALEILWNLLIPARKTGDEARQAFLYIHMGRVYSHWMWDVAQKFYRQGMEAAQACGYPLAELVACCSLGELYQGWGEPHRALGQFERSLELAEAEGDAAIQHIVLLEMAACCKAKGERDREATLRARAEALVEELTQAGAAPAGVAARYERHRDRVEGQVR